jgi:hypothetical protein
LFNVGSLICGACINAYEIRLTARPCTRIDTANEDGPWPASSRSVNSEIEREDLVRQDLVRQIRVLESAPGPPGLFAIAPRDFPINLHRGCHVPESPALSNRAFFFAILKQPR